jgi:hypothetical protein
MKRIILVTIFGFLFIAGLVSYVSAITKEISLTNTKILNSQNNICEYYEKQFSNGETENIQVNGVSLSITFKGENKWKLNDWEGEVKNHGFFVYNENKNLQGVRFDFSGMGQYSPEGNFKINELKYYPWDCQGYSKSTGLISEVKIAQGWNLVPTTTPLRDCYYAHQGELCKEDVLVSYIYIPTLNKYFTEEEIEKNLNDPAIREYFSEENELNFMKASKWIYVKKGSGNKKVIGNFGAYIPYRNEYLENDAIRLYRGWNFLYVDAFMVFDDNWQENPLSLNDMKGSCNIEKAYIWDFENQQWGTITNLLDDKRILKEEGGVGGGFVVKVLGDCALGNGDNPISPPELPGDTYVPDSCVVAAPFGCTDWAVNQNSIQMGIRNGAGETLEVKDISISGCGDYIPQTTSIASEETYNFLITCSNNLAAGTRFIGDVLITYNKVGSSLELKSAGKIVGDV